MRARAGLALLAVALTAPATAAAAPRHLRVGGVTLHRCAGGAPGYCGSVPRLVDPALSRGPRLRVGFEWLPASRTAHPRGTIVANEGGPGYPSSGTVVEYTGTYGPLLRDHNLLLVDNRGTGMSGLIDCRRLQRWTAATVGPVFAGVVGACGRSLDHRYRTAPGGPWLRASDLFTTGLAAEDLAAVLGALRLGRVDLYGDSYGTWFSQAFIARFPALVRSVVLDSAYPVRGLSPWYGSSGTSGRAALDAVCRRDPGCRLAAPRGTATGRLARLVRRLRHRRLAGVMIRDLVNRFQDAGSDPVVWRELDASVRAALGGDPLPLRRLVAEAGAYNTTAGETAAYFSDGLYFAVGCPDYPQLFPLGASPASRRAAYARSLAHAPRDFFPFTPREWVGMSAYSETYDACLDWPRPTHRIPVLPARVRRLPASVPMLVVGGDLDDLTPLSDARRLAPRLARNVRVVTLRNTVHVTSEGDTYLGDGALCARQVIRAFTRAPSRLRTFDASCAARIPAIHTPGSYPRRLRAAARAHLVRGPDPGAVARRAVTVAAGAAADATIRTVYGAAHRGLRGGRFTSRERAGVTTFHLVAVRYTRDTRVTGTVRWRLSTGAVSAALRVLVPGRRGSLRVRLAWTQRTPRARAVLGRSVLSLPAP